MLVKFVESNPIINEFNALKKALFADYKTYVEEYVDELKAACSTMTPIMDQRFEAFWQEYNKLYQSFDGDLDLFRGLVDAEIAHLIDTIWMNKYNG
ncbi:hypothetical protein LCGC14_1518810 [marine sediment metagenome]|uniref:Uncharacterized protein n=1 Tax=marine sediment metagenome TaxID=412755 RepID=A0A0F9IZE8_9ZZZZ